MASAWTLDAPDVVIIRRCTSEMRPCGNSTIRSTLFRPANASTAAPPVTPEVATTTVVTCASAPTGEVKWDPACFGYTIGAPGDDLSFDERDSAPFVPKCVVVDPNFD